MLKQEGHPVSTGWASGLECSLLWGTGWAHEDHVKKFCSVKSQGKWSCHESASFPGAPPGQVWKGTQKLRDPALVEALLCAHCALTHIILLIPWKHVLTKGLFSTFYKQ